MTRRIPDKIQTTAKPNEPDYVYEIYLAGPAFTEFLYFTFFLKRPICYGFLASTRAFRYSVAFDILTGLIVCVTREPISIRVSILPVMLSSVPSRLNK